MQARIHVITLAVTDLERALAFYRDGLGLDSPGVVGTEFVGDDTNAGGAAAMFQLQGGLILALYPRPELAKVWRVQYRPRRCRSGGCGRTARAGRNRRGGADRPASRPSLGNLFWLFP